MADMWLQDDVFAGGDRFLINCPAGFCNNHNKPDKPICQAKTPQKRKKPEYLKIFIIFY